jgi:hypothetical protein
MEKKELKLGCKRCGYPGHFTYECRNFVRLDPAKELTLDISSTSSDTDSDTPLQALRKYELERRRTRRSGRRKIREKIIKEFDLGPGREEKGRTVRAQKRTGTGAVPNTRRRKSRK